eukprot:CAMPEP_0201178504 /NCGR_PEP_ID=MMETSP0851-20130426/110785_1 /ASSEMBLY_ACC=CAM_ASM_000631 /TAXON_ID=183588 /ORGANISM="Pseudo-nitzschia fraudulenta, Strain WWA7" /LENGTH=518 /DNA_ID=CAMNT_0047462303 /DNA_START=18 /DNA_END=1571 /DNA_ORIENTATION=+
MATTKKRKVLVCCFGSRGDVQPFAALARGLQDYNGGKSFDVLGITNVNDGKSIFDSLGVEARGVHFDMADFIRDDPKMKKALETGNAVQFGLIMSKAFVDHFPKEFSMQWKIARDFKPDLIVASTLMFLQASSIGQALRVPVVHADLGIFSFLPVSKHTQTEMHEPKCLHKALSFFCVAGMLMPFRHNNKDGDSLYGTMRHELQAIVPESERLLGQDGGGQYVREWMNPLTPNLFAVSDSVLPKSKFDDLPPLYAERSIWTGNWYVSKIIQEGLARSGDHNFSNGDNDNNKDDGNKKPEENTQTTILEFIEKQRKHRAAKKGRDDGVGPAYIGWGSMVAVSSEHMIRLAVQSLKLAGLSGIVLGGFAKLNQGLLDDEKDKDLCEYAEKHVLFLQSAPHEWLFPRCSVTVHHGGAGTTAAALRSGVPTIVTPCIADQYDNATLVEEAGCGIGFKKPLRRISPKQLASAIAQCATGKNNKDSLRSNCRRVAGALEKEDGIQNAIEEIENFIAKRLDSGQW